MQFTLKVLTIICVSLVAAETTSKYHVPELKIEALKPQGLRVSLPDAPGVKFFEFHANINEGIKEKEIGDIFNRVTAPYQDSWMFDDKSVTLHIGDVINYWVLVWNEGETFTKHGLSYKVEDLVQ